MLLYYFAVDSDSALNTEEIRMTASSGAVHSNRSENKTHQKNKTEGNMLIWKLPHLQQIFQVLWLQIRPQQKFLLEYGEFPSSDSSTGTQSVMSGYLDSL